MRGSVVPIVSKEYFLSKVLNQTLSIKLFVNNIYPNQETTLSDLTECTLSGYSPKQVTLSDWYFYSWEFFSAAEPYNDPEFQFNESGDIYGYYIVDSSNNLIMVNRFYNAPISVANDGKKLTFNVNITLY